MFFIFFINSITYTLLFLLTLFPLLVSVAFLTLLERKAMASFQSRRGPNIVGFVGFLQPVADGIKLLLKETIIPYKASFFLFILAPLLAFCISIILWFILPIINSFAVIHGNLTLLLIFGFSSLNVYGIILSGWSSNSNYALLGALRSAAQMISYEVSMGLTLLPVILYVGSFNLLDIVQAQQTLWFIFLFPICAIFFFISILAETNRSPFDLPEAEAELVSGYNVDYSSLYFALFFLAEYANILFMAALFVVVFLGGGNVLTYNSLLFFIIKHLFVIFLFIWVRSAYPRYRFDQLMFLGWKVILPLMLSFSLLLIIVTYLIK
jgi:NADH-quinone oxidoreductase subunit H